MQTCAQCEASLNPGDVFCGRCGARVASGAPDPVPAAPDPGVPASAPTTPVPTAPPPPSGYAPPASPSYSPPPPGYSAVTPVPAPGSAGAPDQMATNLRWGIVGAAAVVLLAAVLPWQKLGDGTSKIGLASGVFTWLFLLLVLAVAAVALVLQGVIKLQPVPANLLPFAAGASILALFIVVLKASALAHDESHYLGLVTEERTLGAGAVLALIATAVQVGLVIWLARATSTALLPASLGGSTPAAYPAPPAPPAPGTYPAAGHPQAPGVVSATAAEPSDPAQPAPSGYPGYVPPAGAPAPAGSTGGYPAYPSPTGVPVESAGTPGTVITAAVVTLIWGVLNTLLALVLIVLGASAGSIDIPELDDVFDEVGQAIAVVGLFWMLIAGWLILIGVQILRRRNWARYATLATHILFSLITLLGVLGDPDPVGIVILVIEVGVVALLLTPQTKQARWV